jgi:hypothetical protein
MAFSKKFAKIRKKTIGCLVLAENEQKKEPMASATGSQNKIL